MPAPSGKRPLASVSGGGKLRLPLGDHNGRDMSEYEQKLKEIDNDIKANKVILYMKGEKAMPQCGFSARVVQVLNNLGAEYTTRNVLTDNELREAIKVYSDWPTLPQLYVSGEFVGGADIVAEMNDNGELKTVLGL